MRLISILRAQHLGWTFKKHWQAQGKRIPTDTGAAKNLQNLGIRVKDFEDITNQKMEKIVCDCLDNSVIVGENVLSTSCEQGNCYTYGDSNVLLDGVRQAQVLTRTAEIARFPKTIKDLIYKTSLHSDVHRHLQHSILASHVLDAEQLKLSKVKLQDRLTTIQPRAYGISHSRKNRLLVNKLLAECERLSGKSVNSNRRLLDDADFKVTIRKGDDLLQFQISAEKFITSSRGIEQLKHKCNENLPDLYPITSTISLQKKSICTTETFYPLSKAIEFSHPHTLITFFDKKFTGNLHKIEVTGTQFKSRTILKAFAVAAARAKQLYGETADGNLPTPIVVQCIHTDGRSFHFGVFQLNTLILEDTGDLKNYWFHESNMDLFTECSYKSGRPYLEGYNKDVFRILYAFYNNM